MKIIKHARFKGKGGNIYSLNYNCIYPVLKERVDSGYRGYVIIDDKGYEVWVYASLFEDVSDELLRKVLLVHDSVAEDVSTDKEYVVYDEDKQNHYYRILNDRLKYVWVAIANCEYLTAQDLLKDKKNTEPDLTPHPQHRDTRYGYILTKEQLEDLYKHGSDANKERLEQLYPDLFAEPHKFKIEVYYHKKTKNIFLNPSIQFNMINKTDLELIDTIEKEYKF